MVTLYGIKTCDTCRKARRTLDDLGIAYRYHDLREDGLDATRLDAFLARSDWNTLLNTRSTTWRGLDDADKRDLDVERARALLLAHPTLLKRPVLETPDHFLVGFKADAYRALQAA
ncbi:ArsC family reductase [Chromohalobacter sp. 11-W]|uniref:ArsC family reductase n=1 Tax=Chromohalobacter sp. 11-W TaxID=2994061 RepID=UPI0024685E0E|nr:ArsC family reductase [Chromohalobacter sp. 11-W]